MIFNKKSTNFVFFALFFQLVSQIAFAKIEIVLGDLPLKDNPNIALQAPSLKEKEILISRNQYVISYNRKNRNPNWVAWKLESKNLGSVQRTNSFDTDPDLENYLTQNYHEHAVNNREYSGSCFDRGHQIPSADRTDTEENNISTFLMSNMLPQTPYLNRVIWAQLENYTRNLIRSGKKVYVIAGPIYNENFGTIGPDDNIQIPSKNFKIIIVLNQNQEPKDITSETPILSVIMPNTDSNGAMIQTKGNCGKLPPLNNSNSDDWKKYETSLSEIENLTGINFSFPQITTSIN